MNECISTILKTFINLFVHAHAIEVQSKISRSVLLSKALLNIMSCLCVKTRKQVGFIGPKSLSWVKVYVSKEVQHWHDQL